jgi:hypothetical protein
MVCQKCDCRWEAAITEEYGIKNFDKEKDVYCPDCGMEGVDALTISPFGAVFDETFNRLYPNLKVS